MILIFLTLKMMSGLRRKKLPDLAINAKHFEIVHGKVGCCTFFFLGFNFFVVVIKKIFFQGKVFQSSGQRVRYSVQMCLSLAVHVHGQVI